MAKILITGATAGIGEATAKLFAQKGHSLVLTGRRKDRLEKLKTDLGENVEIFSFDISSRKQVEAFYSLHEASLADVDILINNAGLALGAQKIAEANVDDWETMIDTNIKGLLYMTRLQIPLMLKRQAGHIVNLGSVAGRWVYPGGNVYCATKFAVRALSEGIRQDLLGQPIRVSNIEPGMVETEFSIVRLGDEDRAKKVYAGMTPLTAQDIAETIAWVVDRPKHVNIQELVIFPTDQAAISMVHRQ